MARRTPLPADDPDLFALDLDGLARRWTAAAERLPMTAAEMTGADARAQRLGVPGSALMEHAGAAVAAAARALAEATGRLDGGRSSCSADPATTAATAWSAARHLARVGLAAVAVVVSAEGRPGTPDAAPQLGPPGRYGAGRAHPRRHCRAT